LELCALFISDYLQVPYKILTKLKKKITTKYLNRSARNSNNNVTLIPDFNTIYTISVGRFETSYSQSLNPEIEKN